MRQVLRLWQYWHRNGGRALFWKIQEKLRLNHSYVKYCGQHGGTQAALDRQRLLYRNGPLISLIVPVYNTPKRYLVEMIRSVQAQSYGRWELCLADGSTDDAAWTVIKGLQQTDQRIKCKRIAGNKGIAGNSNEALQMASGDYAALLDHDDLLSPDALFEVVRCISSGDVPPEVVYSDEDKTDAGGGRFFDPHFKPGFSWGLLRCNNYICHFFVVSRSLLERYGIVFSTGFDGAQDYDFILRCVEQANAVVHIPRVLYHWRVHSASTAGGAAAKGYTHEAGRRALQAHLKRQGIAAEVADAGAGRMPNFYRIKYRRSSGLVSILIFAAPNRCQEVCDCLRSVWSGTNGRYEIVVAGSRGTLDEIKRQLPETRGGHVRWVVDEHEDREAVCNEAASQAAGNFLVFMDDGIRLHDKDWMLELLAQNQQEDVGLTAPCLLDRKGRILSAGMMCSDEGRWLVCYRNMPKTAGYMQRLFAVREFSAVDGRLFMVRTAVFHEFGGFCTGTGRFPVESFCLSVREQGWRVLFDPYSEAVCIGGERRPDERSLTVRVRDPYYNPNYVLLKFYVSDLESDR